MSFYLVDDTKVTHDHDPNASRIYGIDVARTMAEGDSVASAQASVDGGAFTACLVTGTKLGARVTGGTVGTTRSVTFRWVTALGDTDDRTIYLNVVER